MTDALRLTQLICSRLCHDLVGAAGAVNAGLEILEEMGGLDDAAMNLAATSGHEMTRRLTFFRVAFGAGGTGGNDAETGMLRKLSMDFLAGGNVKLDWPDVGDPPRHIPLVMGKLLLNLVLIAAECLPRGGMVRVKLAEIEGGVGMAIEAAGPDAGLREDLATALTPGQAVETLDSRNIHGLLAQLLVLEAGCELEISAENDVVQFAAVSV